jgi:Arc/MetJ-type ribon-helix-helix transcriptional regulator
MAKDTVRYPDQVVERIDRLVDDGVFESKSEFHRFAAEYVLFLLDEGYDPEMFSFDELRTELALDDARVDAAAAVGDGGRPFLEAAIAVRRHGLRGEYEAAERYIDDQYDPVDRESLLLDELLGRYRDGDRPAGDVDPSR